ncbi:FCD domain-containing protein [Rhodobacteraceae bacterium 2CG4]|uniref:FCD domain-containing protein n=1 Tax=Halovulum marinum TaxID=2662447 RepID=A0A6L5Z5Z6_9RHOB|nr:Ldh family oxidoreductase [Halovulum marinum]MSU91475.1 FCD domain-containing protein [Halovulum marinum]
MTSEPDTRRGMPQKLSDRAREQIRARIIAGDLPLGSVLRETELADALGMSKIPVREALVQLEREGMISMSPNRSARVFDMSPDDIRSLGEMRELLEAEALRLVLDRDGRTLAADLTAIVERMRTALKSGDARVYKELDNAFHHAIFAHCGNAYLEKTFQMLAFRVQALRNRLSLDMKLNDRSFAEHEALVRHVATQDAEAALKLLRDHIRDTTQNYLAQAGARPAARPPSRVRIEQMERFALAALAAAGADADTAAAVVKALSHASVHGVDTHGYRLLPHYLEGLRRGRLNPRPEIRLLRESSGAALLDGDDGHGARATYAAAAHAIRLAQAGGAGAVAIRGSSHFGAAGAYAVEIARAGMVGFCFCNSDAFVRLHGGAQPFHGTNPIAMAGPAGADEEPWLFDMATSAIPFNKVQLSRALGIVLPLDTASNASGVNVTDPDEARMLAPLGGGFGYKGAGLAGISEILSAALPGAPLSHELPPMISDDMETPRRLGAFVLALDPAAFAGLDIFTETLRRYRDTIRASATAPGATVMAAGDREWEEARRRRASGILLDMTAVEALARFGEETGIPPLELAET